jgi:hypothetical protein
MSYCSLNMAEELLRHVIQQQGGLLQQQSK